MHVHVAAEIVYKIDTEVPGSKDNERMCCNSCFQITISLFWCWKYGGGNNILCLLLNSYKNVAHRLSLGFRG